jgi:hypothetical protein
MPSRRETLLAVSATVAALASGARALARPASAQRPAARLETLLFNLADDLAPQRAAEVIESLRGLAASPGVAGLRVGRNLNAVPFPSRFEWFAMLQFDPAIRRGSDPAYQRVRQQRNELATAFRNFVECDVAAALPAQFAQAPGVKVRHTVMFNFKAGADHDARARNVAAIRKMGKLPMVQHYLVTPGELATNEPGRMQWQVIGDFASLADFQAYYAAPDHLAMRDDFVAHTSRVAFIDIEL